MQITTIFEPIFELVGKDSTLTGRIYIWREAIIMIKSSILNFVIGYGNTTNGYIRYNNTYYTSHNMILEILLKWGIALVLFCLLAITA